MVEDSSDATGNSRTFPLIGEVSPASEVQRAQNTGSAPASTDQLLATIGELSARLNDWHLYRLKADTLSRAVETATAEADKLRKELATAKKTANKLSDEKALLARSAQQLLPLQETLNLQAADIKFLKELIILLKDGNDVASSRLAEFEAISRFPILGRLHALARKAQLRFAPVAPSTRALIDIETSRAALLQSGYFNASWYLQTYPDVAGSGLDAPTHYLQHGAEEFRNPGPDFDTRTYLHASPDVALAGLNPVLHYVQYGQAEGRPIMPPGAAPLAERAYPAADIEIESAARTSASNTLLDPATWPAIVPAFAKFVPVKAPAQYIPEVGETAEHVTLDSIPIGRAAPDGPVINTLGEQIATFCLISSIDPAFRASAAQGLQIAGAPVSKSPELTTLTDEVLWASWVPLADAWMATDFTLRLRFAPCELRIARWRGFQIDRKSGAFTSIGELSLPADGEPTLVDLVLLNPYAPVLVVLCDIDGTLLGTITIPFPSLTRGAPHFGELLAQGNQLAYIEMLKDYSFQLIEQQCRVAWQPGIGTLEIDLRGAIGGELIFAPTCLEWLVDQLGVAVAPLDHGIDIQQRQDLDWLISSIPQPASVPAQIAKLRIPADCIPSLSILIGLSEKLSLDGHAFIVADEWNLKPYGLITLPHGAKGSDRLSPPSAPSRPTLIMQDGATDNSKAIGRELLAIRFLRQSAPVKSALLAPINFDLGVEAVCSVVEEKPELGLSVICCASGNPQRLAAALEALSLQHGNHRMEVLVTCDPSVASETAQALMRIMPQTGRLILCPQSMPSSERFDKACAAAAESLLLVLSEDIILHDRRTLSVMKSLLWNWPQMSSVGCMLIHETSNLEENGVSVIGATYLDDASGAAIDPTAVDSLLIAMPPALWPVAQPMQHLALLRRTEGTENANQHESFHGLTTAISATLLADSPALEALDTGVPALKKAAKPLTSSLRYRRLIA